MTTAISEFLYWTSACVLGLVFLLLLLAAIEVGYRVGRRARVHRATDSAPELSTVQAAILGLLGLLLAFTYSFVAGRQDARKQAVIEEANTLGTAYLRTQLVPGRASEQLRGLLREYARTRVISRATVETEEELQNAIIRSEQVQSELWPTAVKLVEGRAPTPLDSLLFQSVNGVIDMHTRRLAASRDRLPGIILAMLVVVAVMSLGITGFSAGLAARRSPFLTTALAVIIAAVTLVIIDLDRPHSGFVRVSQQPLTDALKSMEEAGATPGAPGFHGQQPGPNEHQSNESATF